MRRDNFRHPLPAVIMSNVQSLNNKIDELRANVKYVKEYKNSCVLCFTESWPNNQIPDSHVELEGFHIVRLDRTIESGKQRRGGLYIYINSLWCKNVTVKSTSCDHLVEILVISCRPFYLPRELTCLQFIRVYIPGKPTNERDHQYVVDRISDNIMKCQNGKPDSAIFILGDFNRLISV